MCIHAQTHTHHTRIYLSTFIHTHLHTRTYTQIHTQKLTYKHKYTRAFYAQPYALKLYQTYITWYHWIDNIRLCILTYTCVCTVLCMWVCKCICAHECMIVCFYARVFLYVRCHAANIIWLIKRCLKRHCVACEVSHYSSGVERKSCKSLRINFTRYTENFIST